ncbi:MAG: hypothetical protein GC160_05765 [Acidobacteria bacterium]|nr:hypothetical protein [Acidobacteriota bacterium]
MAATKGAKLDGISIPTAGVPAWPVRPGSVITTGDYAAVLLMDDGSRYDVAPNSTAVVEKSGATAAIVRVLDPAAVTGASSEPSLMAAASAAPAQVRTTAAATPQAEQLTPISVVDKNPVPVVGPPPAGPPCSGFPPVLVSLGLVRCTP